MDGWRRRSAHALSWGVLTASTLVIQGCGGGEETRDPSEAVTSTGVVQGSVGADQRAFLGVPYAAPPVGPLRWKPPVSSARWTEVRQATTFAKPCLQPITDSAGKPALLGDEDCLYLNIYGPIDTSRKLPVVVFLHGGAFKNGSGSDYDPTSFSRKGGVVVVTINYRLGVFGFLAHPALGAEAADGSSGQYGMLDQRLALEWVRLNAQAFGGDSNNVTLAGESSGAYSVCSHLTSPASSGLFHKVILQSGACTSTSASLPQGVAESAGGTFSTALGCTSNVAECLRGINAAQLVSAPPAERVGANLGWAPAQGGTTLPKSPAAAIRAGEFNAVPTLAGSNHDEYRVFVALQELGQAAPIGSGQYTGTVNGTFGNGASSVLSTYPLASYAAPDLALSALFTDFAFTCPVLTSAALLSSRSSVYAYEFDDPTAPAQVPSPFIAQASYHGAELPYLFRQPTSQFGFGPVTSLTTSQQVLADEMAAYWAAFAATGSPNVAGLPTWSSYTPAVPNVERLTLSGVSSSMGVGADHRCAFWAAFGV